MSGRERFERDALPLLDDVYRYARSLAGQEADAQDLVQDTFFKALGAWDSFTPGTNLRAWLFTICKNTFRRRFSRERARPDVERLSEDPQPVAVSHVLAHRSEVSTLIDRIDIRPTFETALRQLPEPFRDVVILVDQEELSYEEAADALGVPIGTVRSRLFRARRRLQTSLRCQAEDLGLASLRDAA